MNYSEIVAEFALTRGCCHLDEMKEFLDFLSDKYLIIDKAQGSRNVHNMTKYYFISYQGYRKGILVTGHDIMKVTNCSLTQISDHIASSCDLDSKVVILCLKDLTEEEFEMLNK